MIPESEFPEQFSRTLLVLGAESVRRLQQSRVAIIGLGAVGGYALEAMARLGVGHLRLIDFDRVQLSNLNRQPLALHSTIGLAKIEVARQRVLDINPACQVEALQCYVDAQTLPSLLDQNLDLVVDAIDSIEAKVELLAAARLRSIPVVSSMGAARRLDPTRLRVATLADTQGCPLARAVRNRLRARNIPLDIPCVFSTEAALQGTLGLLPSAGPNAAQAEAYAKRVLGSMPTVTGIAGLLLAHVAAQALLTSVRTSIK
jgi:tRNA threonylcarbamoyladenosine dehydratase